MKELVIKKCFKCGAIVKVLKDCKCSCGFQCCGEEMKLLNSQTEETMREKHKPVITIEDKNVTIRVGAVPPPMLPEHHIEFIEAIQHFCYWLAQKRYTPYKLTFVGNNN